MKYVKSNLWDLMGVDENNGNEMNKEELENKIKEKLLNKENADDLVTTYWDKYGDEEKDRLEKEQDKEVEKEIGDEKDKDATKAIQVRKFDVEFNRFVDEINKEEEAYLRKKKEEERENRETSVDNRGRNMFEYKGYSVIEGKNGTWFINDGNGKWVASNFSSEKDAEEHIDGLLNKNRGQ